MTSPFFTIGHSNRSLEEFVRLLVGAGIELVADIRKIPRSRTNPQFNSESLPLSLSVSGISYEHIAALGGRRSKIKGVASDTNRLWTNGSFRNYADYALSEEFAEALAHLRAEGHKRRTAMMCSEAVWWRCHRRIVADHLIGHGESVCHIMGKGRIEPARLTPGAVIDAHGQVTYPASRVEMTGAREYKSV